ncbi:putative lysine-specific demethylase 4A [Dirofilaria immitis]|nr:putative lysine-specific demethylase 4A [Dirofilaria immitis]
MDTSAASTSANNQHHPLFTSTGTLEVPVFYPTIEEMRDFPALISKIEQEHRAHLICGIAKIVPPPEFHARKSGDYSDVDNYVIDQSITVREFRALAKKSPFPKGNLSPQEIERYYWKHVLQGEPVYGADSPGTICDTDLKEFNMNRLGTLLDMLDESGVKIKGVNTVYLYFGMWKTTFPWHPEDMDLYSINYVHFGKPKFWYAIATDSLNRFERFAAQCFPSAAKTCKSFLRHKTFMISPQMLRKITLDTEQWFIRIALLQGYHMGFNIGYNCAESTNFASDRWIDFGKNALVCGCRSDSVEIDMRPFMKAYRATEYDEWYQYWYGERLVKDKSNLLSVKL